MNKPNFQEMTQKELQNYVLKHKDDQTAFYAYVDKLNAEGNWIEMPALNSLEDLQNYPEFINRFSHKSQT